MKTESESAWIRADGLFVHGLIVAAIVLSTAGCVVLDGSQDARSQMSRADGMESAGSRTELPLHALQPVCVDAGVCADDVGSALIAFHGALWTRSPDEVKRAQDALDSPPTGALSPPEQLRHAILLGHPRASSNLAGARSLLDAVLVSSSDEARALHPLATLLANEWQSREQLHERMRRLESRLETVEREREQLQQKIDALAEIERSLPARPDPDATLPVDPLESDAEPQPAPGPDNGAAQRSNDS